MVSIIGKLIERQLLRTPDLAEEFPVSVRTIYSDIRKLYSWSIINFKGPRKTGGYVLTEKGTRLVEANNGERYRPHLTIEPDEFIKEELEARNWQPEDLAEISRISLGMINELLHGKQTIAFEVAEALSRVFGQSPQYWVNLDTNYRLRCQRED